MYHSKCKYKRFYRVHIETNKREIKSFPPNDIPTHNDPNYTQWQRGHGPMPEEQYRKIMAAVEKNVKGKPKSLETKEKMRQAKLGKPKSEEHRRNMSIAQKNSEKARESRKKMHAARHPKKVIENV